MAVIADIEDRRHVNAWRGLKAHVLDQLDVLDRDALAAGCRFAADRERNIRSRERCRQLRGELGIDHMEKARS